MSFDSLLIHICDIGLLSQGAKNAYGTPAKTWPTATYSDEPCRLMAVSGREVKIGAEVVIADKKLFLGINVDVDEQDRISNLRLASTGTIIDATIYEILLVQAKSDAINGHHQELLLRKIE